MCWMVAAMAASVVMSAMQAKNAAAAQQGEAKYNAAVARNNATMAEYKAQDAISRGKAAEEEHSRKVAGLIGTQRNTMAAHGLDLSEGMPLDIMSDTELLGSLDQKTIRLNSEKEAWASRVEASNFNSQASMFDTQAKNSNPSKAFSNSLLVGSLSAASKWYSMGQGLGGGGGSGRFGGV